MLQNGLLLLAAVTPPVLLRFIQMAQQRIDFSRADLRGLLSDFIISTVVCALLIWLARRTRTGTALAIVAWCLINFGNYEHISTLGASADVTHIGYFFDRTFFLGSVLSLSSPVLLLLLLGVVSGLLLAAFRMPQKSIAVWPGALSAGVCVIALFQLPLIPNALDWRQANLIEENILRLLQAPDPKPANHLSAADSKRLALVYNKDLSGKPIMELTGDKHNVLLVILEGISGIHLESLAKVHGIDNAIKLPELDQIAQQNMAYSNFVTHNRQTNRGEYAILCGDLPVLINAEPKMTRALGWQDVNCLPDILRSAGYNTAYLQAAPLGFMSKDSFMPLAGFDEVQGESWFANHYARNQWGIDDRAFLLQSADKIRQLQQAGAPWFLTLLTVGTHHPYIVPAEFGERNFPTAARYADKALAEFLEKIDSMGVMKDTLVIITSDESVGISGYRGSGAFTKGQQIDDVTRKIADNWGFLIALTPLSDRQRIDEPFAHVDMAISILDYLGLTGVPNSFIGRSFFRQYESTRPLVFGNLYKKYLGAFNTAGELRLCKLDLSAGCEHFSVSGNALFSPERKSLGPDPEAASLFRSVIAASEERQHGDRVIALVRDTRQQLQDTHAMQVIFGGQYISTEPHSMVSVELDVTLVGPPGNAQLGILLQSDQGNHFGKTLPRLKTGDRLTLAFDYYSPAALESLALIGTVVGVDGQGMQLDFARAELRVSELPDGERAKDSRLTVHSSGISSAN